MGRIKYTPRQTVRQRQIILGDISMTIMVDVQKELKAPKNQFNKFGKYNYRNCEDIVEAVKPLLETKDCYLNISDKMVMLGDRFYVEASACVFSGKGELIADAIGVAREPFAQKGMQEPQITGSASSYARKYALNGLFAIDDTKDADSQDNREYVNPEPINQKKVEGVLAMYVEVLSADAEEIDYKRMQDGDARLSNDERIEVMNRLKAMGKFPESNKGWTTIVNEYLKHKEGDEL